MKSLRRISVVDHNWLSARASAVHSFSLRRRVSCRPKCLSLCLGQAVDAIQRTRVVPLYPLARPFHSVSPAITEHAQQIAAQHLLDARFGMAGRQQQVGQSFEPARCVEVGGEQVPSSGGNEERRDDRPGLECRWSLHFLPPFESVPDVPHSSSLLLVGLALLVLVASSREVLRPAA
jgi:hypothetical protein